MSHSASKAARAGLALGVAALASGALASSASAGVTTFKVTGTKLIITAANNDVNNIKLEAYGGPTDTFRIKDLGAGVTLSAGAGIGSTVSYSSQDIAFLPSGSITSIRIKAGNQNDQINTTLTDGFPGQYYGGPGNDVITVGDGAVNTISGGSGNDTLNGGDQDDVFVGGTGDDLLFGNDGDDVFFTYDDTGSDDIDGGNGDDHATVDGNDTISLVESIQIGD